LPPELGLRGTLTYSRALPGGVDATVNAEAAHTRGHALSGLSEQLPAELNRNSTDDSLHLGGTLAGDQERWHWNLASNADVDRQNTTTSKSGVFFAPGSAESTREGANVDATANGPLFASPAGDAHVTVRAAGAAEHLHIDQDGFSTPPAGSTNRTSATGAVSVDLPVSHRGKGFSALGNLTVNGNAEVDELSDFGMLMRTGIGANWSPIDRLELVGGWSREQEAPSVRQLGDPFVQTPGTRIFDFTGGIVTRAAVVTGGNPDLRTNRTDALKLSAGWQPFDAINFRLRADYAHVSIDRPISDITVSPLVEAAFPERFVRDSSGTLLSVDLRPVNFRFAHRDTLRLGFDFSKPLKSHKVSQAEVQKLVDKARASGIAVPEAPASSANASF